MELREAVEVLESFAPSLGPSYTTRHGYSYMVTRSTLAVASSS